MITINRYIFVAAVSVYGGHAADNVEEFEMENLTEKRKRAAAARAAAARAAAASSAAASSAAASSAAARAAAERAAATKIQSVLRMHAVKIRGPRVTDANFVHPWQLQLQSDDKKQSTSSIAIKSTCLVEPQGNETHHPYRLYRVQHAPGKSVYKRYIEFHDLHKKLMGPSGALSRRSRRTSGLPSPPEFPQDARELNDKMVSQKPKIGLRSFKQKLKAYMEYVLTHLRYHPDVQAFISSAPAETLDYQMTLTLPAVTLPKGCRLDEHLTVVTAPDGQASNYKGLTVAKYYHRGQTYTVNRGEVTNLNAMLEKKECSVRFRDISTHFTNLVALGVSHTLIQTATLFHNLWITQKANDLHLPPFPRKFVFDLYPLLSVSKQAFLQGMVQAWFDAVLDKIGIDQPTMKFLETRFLALPLPSGDVLEWDAGTKETTISFSEKQRIVLDEHLKIVDRGLTYFDIPQSIELQGLTVNGYTSDGWNTSVHFAESSDLQSAHFKAAVLSGNCIVSLVSPTANLS